MWSFYTSHPIPSTTRVLPRVHKAEYLPHSMSKLEKGSKVDDRGSFRAEVREDEDEDAKRHDYCFFLLVMWFVCGLNRIPRITLR